MSSFNREKFLYYLLAAVMSVNAAFFAYGVFACSRSSDPHAMCPDIGARFDNYSEKALAAVLGLIAGAGVVTVTRKKSEDEPPMISPKSDTLPNPPSRPK